MGAQIGMQTSDDFKMVMFVGFQSRKDGIALPLLEGL